MLVYFELKLWCNQVTCKLNYNRVACRAVVLWPTLPHVHHVTLWERVVDGATSFPVATALVSFFLPLATQIIKPLNYKCLVAAWTLKACFPPERTSVFLFCSSFCNFKCIVILIDVQVKSPLSFATSLLHQTSPYWTTCRAGHSSSSYDPKLALNSISDQENTGNRYNFSPPRAFAHVSWKKNTSLNYSSEMHLWAN